MGAGWPSAFQPLDGQVVLGLPSAEDNAEGCFEFLAERRDLGAERDWLQADAAQLWRYHLHYFDWAWSFAVHPDRTWARHEFATLWASWRESSPFPLGDAWSPYVVAVRVWNLCGVFTSLVRGQEIEDSYMGDLIIAARYLRAHVERDVGGNHLIKNLKGLIGAAVFMHDDRRLRAPLGELERQLPVQVLEDGGHFERSPSYHCQVLGDLVDVAGLLAAAGRPGPASLDEAIAAMRRWLGSMLMPDGDVPLFNDCTLVGPERVALLGPAPAPAQALEVLEPSGYVVLRSGRLHLVADVGPPCPPELPAHAHADCLSFELAVDGARVVVDTGTSTYGSGPRRAYERSTAAHNTVEVDGTDQTEVWGAFRAARLARCTLERVTAEGGVIDVVASHDGYTRLLGRPVHRRRWHVEGDRIEIDDEIVGDGVHQVTARLHVPRGRAIAVDGSPRYQHHDESAATSFGVLLPVEVLTASTVGPLPLRLHTVLAP